MLDKLELEVMLMDESLVAERFWKKRVPSQSSSPVMNSQKCACEARAPGRLLSPVCKGSEERKQRPTDLVTWAPLRGHPGAIVTDKDNVRKGYNPSLNNLGLIKNTLKSIILLVERMNLFMSELKQKKTSGLFIQSFHYFSAFKRHDVDIVSSVGYFILQVHYCTFI